MGFYWFLETLLRAWKDKSLTGLCKSHIWQRTSIQKIYRKSKVQFNSLLRGKIYEKTLNQDKQTASNHMKKRHYPPGISTFKPQGHYNTPIRASRNCKTNLPNTDWGVEQLHAYTVPTGIQNGIMILEDTLQGSSKAKHTPSASKSSLSSSVLYFSSFFALLGSPMKCITVLRTGETLALFWIWERTFQSCVSS